MPKTSFVLIVILCLSWLAAIAGPVSAADDLTSWANNSTRQLNTLQRVLSSKEFKQSEVDANLRDLTQIATQAQSCVNDNQKTLEEVTQNLESLGEKVPGEPSDVTQKRRELSDQKQQLASRINLCNLLLIQSNELTGKFKTRYSQELGQWLSKRGPSIFTTTGKLLSTLPTQWLPGLGDFASGLDVPGLTDLPSIASYALVAIALITGFWLRRRYGLDASLGDPRDIYDGFVRALRSCAVRALPLFLPLVAADIAHWLNPRDAGNHFIGQSLNALVVFLIALVLVRAVFEPCAPASHYLRDSTALSRSFAHRLRALMTVSLLAYLLLGTDLSAVFFAPLLTLIRGGEVALFVFTGILVLWHVRHFSWAIFPRWLRVLVTAGLLVSLLADLAGYRAFSAYLLGGIVATASLLAISVMLTRLSGSFFDQIDNGEHGWQHALRQRLGFKQDEHVTGLIWFRILVALFVWTMFILIALRAWGLSRQSELFVLETLTQGFQVGSIQIVPSRILLAVLVFALLLGLSRVFKDFLTESWITRTNLDYGAQEAVVTISGYVGFIIAALVALSLAGVEFKNLAVIAGALSVGIGFGLQNIVNNFVSGLILLFERPIRRGDWIAVGNTEGKVKSINIRSTEIETFDRADVIVPNSELISSQVTNRVLHDAIGRVIVPIGVAYGSDTDKVKQLLLEIAEGHSETLTKSAYVDPPTVLFMAFGASSLDFELRFYIRNINKRLGVTSDINFAIDKAFREHKIEIPFPQRDIHIKKGG